jgi:hypothetical protein
MIAGIPSQSLRLRSILPSSGLLRTALKGLVIISCLNLGNCQLFRGPSLEFTRVPPSDKGGPDMMDTIQGRVRGARPGQKVVIFAKSGIWWVQPSDRSRFTEIKPDSTWTNSTHLGTEYAAVLVEPEYQPPTTTEALPQKGDGILAIARVDGDTSRHAVHATLNFSGYDWIVRAAPSGRGGVENNFDPKNAFTDPDGALHLRISGPPGGWTCAEVNLTRSLGYGTYRFVVRDTSKLDPAAVFGIFTWDGAAAAENHRELDIEVSRWSDPTGKDTQYVVQPFYAPANVERFTSPPGVLTHSFHWEPGKATFTTVRGSEAGVAANNKHPEPVAEHVFTSGVPSPGSESVHINLYVAGRRGTLENGTEVVIEKFEYLP